MQHKHALPTGYELHGYRVAAVLGVGGFGVTYLAEHVRLGRRVAIKEYLPNEFAVRDGTTVHPKSEADRESFEWGLERFLDEAQTLTRFEHRNVVQVRDYFEANRTAYIVMDYEEGESLGRLLNLHGRLSEAQLRRILWPIVDGLRQVHAAGYLHRDIKPANVYVRRSDESPVLLDFGAAREALGRKSKSLTAVASAGYSPPEQYESEGEQGPWTDIYALSALCYRAIAGEVPMEAPRRMNRLARGEPDPLPKLSGTVTEGYSPQLLSAVDWGLQAVETQRPGSLEEWLEALERAVAPEAGAQAASSPAAPRSPPEEDVARDRAASARSVRGRRVPGWATGAVAAAAVMTVAIVLGGWWSIPNEAGDRGEAAATPAAQSPPSLTVSPSADEGVADEASLPDMDAVLGGSALLVVETAPSGVEVLVDGEPVGETPLERDDIRAGVHEVTLRHPHYETVRVAGRNFDDGRVVRIEPVLVRGRGALTVTTTPRESWIEVAGERLAERTPVTLENLPAGVVSLTLGAAEHRSLDIEVEIPKDGVARLERTLEPVPHGTLTLALEPPDAEAILPDVESRYRPGVRLPEGLHRVIVRREGYEEAVRSINVSGDTRERIELEPVSQPFTVETTPPTATVVLVANSETYRAGMRLAPGDYRVEVSAPGYVTQEETVRHGLSATRRAVALRRDLRPGVRFADALASGGEGPEMVVVPSGSFLMGSPSDEAGRNGDEGPVHRVTISQPFAVGVYEVTFAEWDACVADGGCGAYRPDDRDWGRGRRPVIYVSWENARSYVSWLSEKTGESYRLLSESEWEYAARAGTTTAFHTGGTISTDQANYDGNYTYGSGREGVYREQTVEVGSFTANAFGLHDMHGNVWEWTGDCWNGSYAGAPTDGSAWERGDCSRRVVRGGAWVSDPGNLRSAVRYWNSTGNRYNGGGFRVARTLTP